MVVKKSDDASLPPAYSPGPGIREVIWGVDTQSALDAIEADLKKDRVVTKDADGTLHSTDDLGLALGFRIFERQPLAAKDDQVNSPGRSVRWNKHRSWYDKATPQLIYHVVFGCSDLDKTIGFYRDRLKFRITDVARDRGVFFRAEGRNDHHNIFWARTGKPQFLHISFGVENLDELAGRRQRHAAQGLEEPARIGPASHLIDAVFLHQVAGRRRGGVFRRSRLPRRLLATAHLGAAVRQPALGRGAAGVSGDTAETRRASAGRRTARTWRVS